MARIGIYLSVAQAWRSRGDEYLARGDKYASEGRMSHAEGCWKKAEKKYLKARALEEFNRHPSRKYIKV